MTKTEPEPISPRLRLQALLAVPDAQRSEAQWDEINELEIMLAPGNRGQGQEQGVRHEHTTLVAQPNPGRGGHAKRPVRNFHMRPRKRKVS
jgi:hypothetical protein